MDTMIRLTSEQLNTLMGLLFDEISMKTWKLDKANEKIDELHNQIQEMGIEKEGNF